jgi:hypothetical protein
MAIEKDLKLRFLIFSALITLALTENFTTIECEFKEDVNGGNLNVGKVYLCLGKNVQIKKVNTIVQSASGNHTSSLSNRDVKGFCANDQVINYFPQNLLKVFPNLVTLRICCSQLLEIHQNDLAPFVDLIDLYLHTNRLKYIEKDLFKYNPRLALIELYDNRIKVVDPNVFDSLLSLKFLRIIGNLCISENAIDNRTKVLILINEIKRECHIDQEAECNALKNKASNETEIINELTQKLSIFEGLTVVSFVIFIVFSVLTSIMCVVSIFSVAKIMKIEG